MKKIFLSLAVLATVSLTSCDMDLLPDGSLNEDEAVETAMDCNRFRSGFYANFRALTSSSINLYPELQCDNFQALAPLYGNQAGDLFKGTFTSATTDFGSAYASLYSVIGTINFFLPKGEALLDNPDFTNQEIAEISRDLGEAHFFRAYYYYMLFDRFCQTWSEDKKNTPALGLQLVTEYHPTADRSSYPGRSTMAESFKLIYDDLDYAEKAIAAWENVSGEAIKPGANYINTMVIKAFRARLALLQGNKADALKYANEVINSGYYELSSYSEYASVWINDDPLKEILFQPFINAAEAPSCNKYGAAYWCPTDGVSALYIPSNATLNAYSTRDCRKDIFFEQRDLEMVGENVPTYCFVKWPGNPAYAEMSTAKGVNTSKPFRLAEMYLIVAECADETAANEALADLRSARIRLYNKNTKYSGEELVNEVRTERMKELIGEGFRLSDLRRWGIGFQRDPETPTPNFPYADYNTLYFVAGGMSLEYKPGDYRMVWPIPSDEIQSNPQMVGQQNPGYGNN